MKVEGTAHGRFLKTPIQFLWPTRTEVIFSVVKACALMPDTKVPQTLLGEAHLIRPGLVRLGALFCKAAGAKTPRMIEVLLNLLVFHQYDVG